MPKYRYDGNKNHSDAVASIVLARDEDGNVTDSLSHGQVKDLDDATFQALNERFVLTPVGKGHKAPDPVDPPTPAPETHEPKANPS